MDRSRMKTRRMSSTSFLLSGSGRRNGTVVVSLEQAVQNTRLQFADLRLIAATRTWHVNRDVQGNGAPIDENDPVGKRKRLADIVRHQDGREALVEPDALEHALHLDARQSVERAQRLVQQEKLRMTGEGASQRNALTLAAGEHTRPLIGAVGQAYFFEKTHRNSPAFGRRLTGRRSDLHVLDDVCPRQEPRLLKHDARAAGRLVGAEFDPSACGLVETCQQAKERAL
ncbi:MAG TPA: hypothetical protein VNR40_07375, partial [Steroidobacter sp.]|nr:hypothetical protein [Steroidobacter sp.]